MFVLMGFVVARWEVSRADAGDVAMWVRAPTTRHRAVTPRPPDLFAEPVCILRAARSVRSGQRTSLRGQGIIGKARRQVYERQRRGRRLLCLHCGLRAFG